MGSFPIDVAVSISIQPCVLRFTCLPTHPMECDLHLPAVDVVLSSKSTSTSDELPVSPIDQSLPEEDTARSLGGLSFSLHMKDFKLNVYHPFSGDSKMQSFDDIRSGQVQTRNALAVSVQSVSINISRIRSLQLDQISSELFNSIRLSAIVQISKAQFEYDIRRFSEILTFPKIWYNRALARRLFLGDENLPTRIRSSPAVTRRIAAITNRSSRKQARILLAVQLKEVHILMRMSNVMGKVEWNTKNISSTASITLSNEGTRTYHFSVGLQSSTLQAEQGIVGGLIRLKNVRTRGKNQNVAERRSVRDLK